MRFTQRLLLRGVYVVSNRRRQVPYHLSRVEARHLKKRDLRSWYETEHTEEFAALAPLITFRMERESWLLGTEPKLAVTSVTSSSTISWIASWRRPNVIDRQLEALVCSALCAYGRRCDKSDAAAKTLMERGPVCKHRHYVTQCLR